MSEFWKQMTIRSIVAIMIIMLSFGVIFILMYKPVPGENKDLINVSIGFVLGSVSGIVSFYFGSSKAQEQSPEPLPPPPIIIAQEK